MERAIKYVKRSYFAAWQPTTLEEANDGLIRWNREIAQVRIHGTTQRAPIDVFEAEEGPVLNALPMIPYEIVLWKSAKVHRDSHIQFDGRLYSVPWTHLGKTVWVKATSTDVVIYAEDVRIASHDRRGDAQRSTIASHLPEGRRDLREHRRSHWELRGLVMGQEVHAYVMALFDQDDALLQLRTVQAVVMLLEKHPPERAQRACVRAHRYGNFTYRGVRDILRKGLDLTPEPEELPLFGRLQRPAFARAPTDFTRRGGPHES